MSVTIEGGRRTGADEPEDVLETGEFSEAVTGESGAEPFDTARLDLDEPDVRLPWLEGDDDLDQYESGGSGKIVGFVLGGLVALAAIVGGIWWATHRGDEPEMIADGGIIEAPAAPYKSAPEDPGGKTFAGTGDTSFGVSVGQSSPARLGQDGGLPKPVPTAAKPVAGGSASAAATPAPSGVGVQVGAFSTQASAEAGWTRLSQQYDALSGVKHRVVEGRADIGTVYRLQALAGDVAGANALCARLKSAGLACQVKR